MNEILNAITRVEQLTSVIAERQTERERREVLSAMLAQLSIVVTDEQWSSALSKATRDVL